MKTVSLRAGRLLTAVRFCAPLCIWPAAACLRRVGLALRCANTMDDGVSLPLSYEEVHRILDIKEIMVHQGSMLHFDGITARL